MNPSLFSTSNLCKILSFSGVKPELISAEPLVLTVINPLFDESDRTDKNEPPQGLISLLARNTTTKISESQEKEGIAKYKSAQAIKAIACKKDNNRVRHRKVNAKPKEIIPAQGLSAIGSRNLCQTTSNISRFFLASEIVKYIGENDEWGI